MGDMWRISDEKTLLEFTRHMRGLLTTTEKGFRVEWRQWRKSRSNKANNLYWEWMTTMAKHFTDNGHPIDKEGMAVLMRHKHLGYEDISIGTTVIRQQLKSSSNCDSGEMFQYMEKVDAWAVDHGVYLPRPDDNEYTHWLEAAA